MQTTYYKFFDVGLEFGIRGGFLNHSHLFFSDREGYIPYSADFLDVNNCRTLNDVIKKIGDPASFGGGYFDPLLGAVNKWIKKDYENFSVRMEFSGINEMDMITFML